MTEPPAAAAASVTSALAESGSAPATSPGEANSPAGTADPSPAAEEPKAPAGGAAAPESPAEPPKNLTPQHSQTLLDAWRDTNLLALPLPPAPPGERGYRPGDVERLMTLLTTAATDPDGPRAEDIAKLKLSRTFFIGQGYHAGAVEALRLAWVSELRRREL